MHTLASGDGPEFVAWLARNTTGVSRASGAARALMGTLFAGLLSTAVARRLRPSAPFAALLAETMPAAAVGGAVSPLGVAALTYYLDRRVPRSDELLGYSGVMRELLHAGELSALGALGAGLGRGVGGGARGALLSVVGTAVVGGLLYAARGLGPGLGAGAGLLSGLFGGLLAGAARAASRAGRGEAR